MGERVCVWRGRGAVRGGVGGNSAQHRRGAAGASGVVSNGEGRYGTQIWRTGGRQCITTQHATRVQCRFVCFSRLAPRFPAASPLNLRWIRGREGGVAASSMVRAAAMRVITMPLMTTRPSARNFTTITHSSTTTRRGPGTHTNCNHVPPITSTCSDRVCHSDAPKYSGAQRERERFFPSAPATYVGGWVCRNMGVSPPRAPA